MINREYHIYSGAMLLIRTLTAGKAVQLMKRFEQEGRLNIHMTVGPKSA